jgi:hypothetical protein
MQTIDQAITYLLQNIKNYDPETEMDDIVLRSVIQEMMLDIVGDQFTEEDMETLDQDDSEEYPEAYLQQRFPTYPEMLQECVKDILTEYIVEYESTEE